nr:MAG TPA: hypothetical protein [Bacteriophage sp.]DAX07372.1 MAG TPA: hypothetical protein [Bacteriophage sp.]DAY13656.1 MAG TPA: hypothetical protein [Bacteriophage sp.]
MLIGLFLIKYISDLLVLIIGLMVRCYLYIII